MAVHVNGPGISVVARLRFKSTEPPNGISRDRFSRNHLSDGVPEEGRRGAGEPLKRPGRQYDDNPKHVHQGRPRLGFNDTHCRAPDLERYGSCYRSSAKSSLRMAKMARQSTAISLAVSFAHETIEP